MPNSTPMPRWGNPPWTIDFHPPKRPLPEETDFAVVGGGFTGLAAAAWLRRQEPHKPVALFEGGRLGAGRSAGTGGWSPPEPAPRYPPGLADGIGGSADT